MVPSIIQVVYRLLSTKGLGRVRTNRILYSIREELGNTSDVGLIFDFVKSSISPEMRNSINFNDSRIDEQIAQCSENGVKFLISSDENYPEKLKFLLGYYCPPIISFYGNSELFYNSSVGFCGSRKASQKGLETAKDCAEQFCEKDITITAGHAAGVDSVAHRVALENYKSTIFVLPEGILRFKPRKEFNNFFNTDNALVISEFAPGMIWASHNAMLRNRTIIGLSDAMIVVEAGLKGGTMDAGLSAIELGRPVFSPVYNGSSGEGNAVLIKKGVAPFYRKKSTGKADISKIIHAIKAPIKPEFEKQDDLF